VRGSCLWLALGLAAGSFAASAAAQGVRGNERNPEALRPLAPLDPRGFSALRPERRRSPAGLLYPFPEVPLRFRPIGRGWEASAALEAGYFFDTGDSDETRFENYSDGDDQLFVQWFDVELWNPENALYFKSAGLGVAREDASYRGEAGLPGWLRIRGGFDRLRRRYANDARNLFQGVGSESLTLRGGLVPGEGDPTALAAVVAGLRDSTLEVERDESVVRVDFWPTPSSRLYALYQFGDRDGGRPFGGALGFPAFTSAAFAETSEPIDNHTHSILTGVDWNYRGLETRLIYEFQSFGNHSDELSFENPLNAGDPDIRYGRFALAPDNHWHHLSGSAAMALPLGGRLASTIAWSRARQDDDLLPPTINSGTLATGLDLGNWNSRAALAENNANTRIDTFTADVKLQLRPWRRVGFWAEYRIHDLDDDNSYQTFNPQLAQIGYVSEDGALQAGSGLSRQFQPGVAVTDNWRYRAIRTSQTQQRWEVGADVRLYAKTRLRVEVDRETRFRKYRVRKKTRELGTGVSVESRALPQFTLRAGYRFESRDGGSYDLGRLEQYFVSSLPGYVPPFGTVTRPYTLAQLFQSDLADRDRHEASASVRWLLRPDMDLALSATLQDDDYGSGYGLRKDRGADANLEWSWQPNPNLQAHLFYGGEWRRRRQEGINDSFALSNDPNAGGPNFPFANAWSQKSRGWHQQLGLGFRVHPAWLKRITLQSDWGLLWSQERIDFAFAGPGALVAGVSAAEAGSAFPTLRYTEFRLDNQLRIELRKGLSLHFYHRYQRSDVRDFFQRGLEPLTTGRSVFLAHVDRDYRVHVFGFSGEIQF